MESVDIISKIIVVVTALFTFIKVLHSIHEHKRKKFKDDFENYKEYLDNYYKTEKSEHSLLLRDKAAQNLTRTPKIRAEVVDYFIDLHEQRLANFDTLIDHYYWGNNYLNIEVYDHKITFSSKPYTSNRFQKIYFISYFLMAFFSGLLFLNIINLSNTIWFDPMVGIASLICALSAINKADNIKEALGFLKIINTVQGEIHIQKEVSVNSSLDLAS